MDAIVFFLAAMVVSGVLFSAVAKSVDDDGIEPCAWFDAERALVAILRSSVGSKIAVTVGGESLVINEWMEIAECVLLEAHVIAEGDGDSDFSALNSILSEVLNDVCGLSMNARLCVHELQNGTPTELFSVPRSWADARVTYASTTELVDSEERTYLVQLCSAPAAGLEPS
jgi:hypothetical protein